MTVDEHPTPILRSAMFGFESTDAQMLEDLRHGMGAAFGLWTDRVSTPQLSCRIYDASASQDEHNCLACSLDDATQDIADYLNASKHMYNQRVALELYLTLLNALWERMRDVFEAIEVPSRTWQRDASRYCGFKTARAWSNFAKHPGFFAYGLHHPIYIVQGSETGEQANQAAAKVGKLSPWVLIDTEFVRENWTDITGQKAKKALAHKTTAAVLLPSPEALTRQICSEYEQFVDQICGNPDYVELLRDFSTRDGLECFWDDVAVRRF